MKKILGKLCCGVMIITSIVCCVGMNKVAYAEPTAKTDSGTEVSSDVMVVGYSLSNEKIVPGDDFTLKVKIKNYSEKSVADNVKVEVYNPEEIAPVYGTVSQSYVGKMEPKETKEVSFDYTSSSIIQTDTVDFQVLAGNSNSSNTLILRVPVGIDAPFKVESVKIPEKVIAGQRTDVYVKYEVVGKDNISNIVTTVEGEGIDTVTSNVGILAPGTTKNQSIPITFENPGTYNADIYISYTTVDGTTNKVKLFSGDIVVADNQGLTDGAQEQITEQVSQAASQGVSKMLIIGASGTVIVLVLCVILLLFYRRKQ